MSHASPQQLSAPRIPTRRSEFLMFLVLALGVWPVIAVGVVGGYGFIIWMFQLLYGPPGPPLPPH